MKKELFKAKLAIWMMAVCTILVANAFGQSPLKVKDGVIEVSHARHFQTIQILEPGDTTEVSANGCDYTIFLENKSAGLVSHCKSTLFILGNDFKETSYDKEKGQWSKQKASDDLILNVIVDRKKKNVVLHYKWTDGGEKIQKYFW